MSLREVARQTGINPGRLSIIERGVDPTTDERRLLRGLYHGLLLAEPSVAGGSDA